MPELPEVETIRRQLDRRLRGRRVASVRLLKTGRETPRGAKFVRAVTGKVISGVERRAKLLIFMFEGGGAMIAHLKMTGRFVFVGPAYESGKHDRAIFRFAAGCGVKNRVMKRVAAGRDKFARCREPRLVWSDIRKFGFIRAVSDRELARITSGYGPEPLIASCAELAKRLERPKTRTVKAALLNQEVIAGIGNIYADEALYRSGIRPMRRLGYLTAADRQRLAREIKNVLRESLARRGTSASDYVDASGERGGFLKMLRVYGRGGEPCKSCRMPVKKTVMGQRGTHYCPKCQR